MDTLTLLPVMPLRTTCTAPFPKLTSYGSRKLICPVDTYCTGTNSLLTSTWTFARETGYGNEAMAVPSESSCQKYWHTSLETGVGSNDAALTTPPSLIAGTSALGVTVTVTVEDVVPPDPVAVRV